MINEWKLKVRCKKTELFVYDFSLTYINIV